MYSPAVKEEMDNSVLRVILHSLSLDFGSECLQGRKKSLSVFVLDFKTKEDDKIVL